MLIHPHDDASDDETRWRAFVAEQGFGHFVASGSARGVAVIVPTQFVLSGDRILFHLARQNPVFEALAENDLGVLSVAGDWAYIPAGWKAIGEEDPRRGVPTTYYAAVQLTGRATVHNAPDQIASVLGVQLADLEPNADLVEPGDHGKLLNGIRAVSVQISEVRAKFKFGGNADQPHRDQIAARLFERGGPGDAAARSHMP